jgi:hypothetical protein
LKLRFLFLLTVAAQVATAGLVTLYSNYSENPSDAGYAYNDPVYGYNVNWNQDWNWPSAGIHPYGVGEAMPFTPGQDSYLQSVSMAMYKWPDNTPVSSTTSIATNHDNLTIELVDSNGSLPNENAVIEVLAVDPIITEDDTTFLHLSSLLQPHLIAGHTYWVIAKPTVYTTADTSDNAVYAWIQNNEGATWNYTINQFNPFSPPSGQWQGYFSQTKAYLAPTLQVIGSDTPIPPAPEPGYLAAGPLAMAITWTWRRRRWTNR